MISIRENLVSPSKYSVKCPYSMTPEFIVMHNTANDASAWNEVSYMIGNDNQVSYHYAIDDKEVVQGIPENRNTWNSGDGGYGDGNRKGLSIEICYSKSGGARFDAAERNTAEFVAQLLTKYDWGVDKIKKHQDFNGKYCPHRTLDMGWDRFIAMVESYLKPFPYQEESEALNDEKFFYSAHVENLGDCEKVHDGQISGTTGFGLRLEAVKIDTSELAYETSLDAKIHIEGIGWLAFNDVKPDTVLGSEGEAKRIEAVEFNLKGLPEGKELKYQVHLEGYGWTGWVKNGFTAGTVGISKRIEAIRFVIE